MITFSEADGVRYLHFGTEWVQGAMRLSQPYRLELEYQRQMMVPLVFAPRPRSVLQLGLGAAALTKFCHRYLPESRVTVVEIDPAVILAARQWFALPPDDARLRVARADGRAYLDRHPESADWLQVDLYDAGALGPVYDDVPFYEACRQGLRKGGVAVFNLFGRGLRRSLRALDAVFSGQWFRLPATAEGNHVVIAFADPCERPSIERPSAERMIAARSVEARFGLAAPAWIEGMRAGADRGMPH